jgi:hypothetical protein
MSPPPLIRAIGAAASGGKPAKTIVISARAAHIRMTKTFTL